MPKSLMIHPHEVRKSGEIRFEPIPVNQYNKTLKDELDRVARQDLVGIHRDMPVIRAFDRILQ